jgi:hypothetical protein
MSLDIDHIINLIKSNLVRALIGGLIGSILFTLMGLYLAPNIIGQQMDVGKLLAPLFGGFDVLGSAAHFLNGIIVFPLAYLALGFERLPGPGWLRGAIFLIPIYLVAMVVVMPLLGYGFFFENAPKAMVALMGHVVFGLAMGAIIGRPAKA